MGAAIAEVLPAAVSVFLFNPMPIVAVNLMLFAPEAGKIAPMFIIGWVGGMLVVFGVLLFLADAP